MGVGESVGSPALAESDALILSSFSVRLAVLETKVDAMRSDIECATNKIIHIKDEINELKRHDARGEGTRSFLRDVGPYIILAIGIITSRLV